LRVLYQEEDEMRKLLTLCLLAATAVVVPAGAQAAHVRSTLTGTVSDAQGWCCGDFGRVQGVGRVSGLGRVSFVADWQSGCEPEHGPLSPDPECFTDEQVVLAKKNGATLTLSGGLRGGAEAFDRGGLVVPWSVTGGTGRFASLSGSGTVSFNPRLDSATLTATVALTGTLSR
jgi:hypothetical protein